MRSSPRATAAGTREVDVPAADLGSAADWLIDWLDGQVGWAAVAGVAHRIVHGGSKYVGPERITPEVLAELRRIRPMDPDHLPGEIAVVERFHLRLPDVPQVACFDTAFHHDLPRVAQIVPIPRRFEAAGVRRYGFHGLSYAYLMEALARAAGAEAAAGRVIVAHLGNGASMAAVHRGRPVDTTMALTPAAGLVMSTRSGDIDPGLPGFLAERRDHSQAVRRDHQPRVRPARSLGDQLRRPRPAGSRGPRRPRGRGPRPVRPWRQEGDRRTGGGPGRSRHPGVLRRNRRECRGDPPRICDGLEFLGIAVDPPRNAAGDPLISPEGGRVQVRIIPTDEESMMARQAAALLAPDR